MTPTSAKAPGRKKAVATRLENEEASPVNIGGGGNKPVSKRAAVKPSPATEIDSEEEEDTRSSNNRYKSVKCSDILSGQVIDKEHIAKIRHHFQMAVLVRDGMDLRDGASNRVLNFHQVLSSAKYSDVPKEVSKRFCTAMKDARTSGRDSE